ncbi:hypothetical protein ACJMK2_001008 [Sinanodonta woodiana]|uniref:non-specific serine/threonine protein kinase n=1 Tax=Sinanodonta woodiana TaxID=1069815 RepID=A0ABD3XUE3_SINWO
MDDRSIQLFEEALKDGEETVHSIRVMVVGHMGVGKTTLVKRLLGDEVNISERHSTEGIDVYVNCCDVSLSTHEWTRRTKDLGQDYSLQRVAKVLNEKHSVAGKVSDELVLNPLENDRTESREDSHAPVKDQNSEMIHHSSGQDVDQNILFATNQQDKSNSHPKEESTSHEQKESSSVVAQTTSTQAKANTIAMIKLLKENFNKIEDSGENSLLTIWDFAGQYAFYTTHQTFLTRRAIYLLVSDVSGHVTDLVADDCYFDSKGKMKCQVHELVEVWLNSIHSCAESPKADSPPVILVGTHVDKISQGTHHEICKRYFREIRSYLKDKPTRFHLIDEDFAIDNTVVDKRLEDLKRKIVEIASQQSYWGEKIPARWLTLEQELMRRKASGVKVISREDVDKINKEGIVPIGKSEEVDLFLRYLHETGLIIYFSVVILRENIVLDPTWLIDVFKTLINSQPDWTEGPDDKVVLQKWSDFKETGILSSELIDAIWTQEKYPELHAHKEHMLLIMEQLNIIAKPRAFSEIGEKNESFFLTPCMLRQESPKEIISPEHDPMLNLKYDLCTWWSPSQVLSEDGSAAPCQMWFSDEGHDSDAPISPEHMNHARIYVALVTVCTRALRDILLSHVPYPYKGIYKAIWAKKADLTKKIQTRRGQWQNALLLPDQCQVVFPDPRGRYVASVDQFDITLLYILIRNVSTVSASVMGWGMDPLEEPFRDKCLGASVERIRSYRNQIGHSMDGKMSQQDFDSYWNKIYAVLADIEQDIGREGYYRAHLDTQKRQVISVYEAC